MALAAGIFTPPVLRAAADFSGALSESESGSAARGRFAGVSPRNERRNAKILGGAAISQWQALGTAQDAAGRRDQGMPGRHIPLASRCETRIHVRGALRDLAKLDRLTA
jgi:hypothetical protein